MKLFPKILLITTIIITAAVFICSAIILDISKENITASVLKEGLLDYKIFQNELINTVKDTPDIENETAKKSYITDAFKKSSNHIEYILQKGDEYLSNNTGIAATKVLQQRESKRVDNFKYVLTEIQDRYYFILSSNTDLLNETYILSLARDVTTSMTDFKSLSEKSFFICIIVAVISAALSGTVLFLQLRNIKKLSKSAKLIASGNYSNRIEIKGNNEIYELAKNFNSMADTAEKQISEINTTYEERKMMLAALSHEMKTPVTAITGYAHMLKYAKLTDEQRKEAIDFVDSECRRLDRLSTKLIQLISLNGTNLELKETNPFDFLENLRPLLELPAAKHEINLVLEADRNTVFIEPDLMTSVIINLFDNARKAESKNIKISIKDKKLSVSDDGCGIPEKEIQNIQKPFYMLDSSRNKEGFGLGLALVNNIAQLHKTKLIINSQENKGTTVSMKLQ